MSHFWRIDVTVMEHEHASTSCTRTGWPDKRMNLYVSYTVSSSGRARTNWNDTFCFAEQSSVLVRSLAQLCRQRSAPTNSQNLSAMLLTCLDLLKYTFYLLSIVSMSLFFFLYIFYRRCFEDMKKKLLLFTTDILAIWRGCYNLNCTIISKFPKFD
jgi:hypothetical protein